jgi:hypothetical protein
MATTGAELWLYTQNIIDKDYSDWISTTKANRLFKAALHNVVEQKIAAMDSQKVYDELNSLIIVSSVLTPTVPGNFVTKSTQIPNYMRLMTIEATMQEPALQGVSVVTLSTATPMTITLNKKTSLRSGSYVRIAGLTSVGPNSLFYLKRLSDKKFQLYTNQALTAGAVYATGTAASITGISIIYKEYCTPIISDKKINKLGVPTSSNPAYEDAANQIIIHPLSSTCTSVAIDYLSRPVGNQIIDVTNAVFDLETVYPMKFLYSVANEFANIFAASTRDQGLYQTSENETVQNP